VNKTFALFFFLAAPITAMAQKPVCAEQTIRDAVQNGTIKYTDDNFFWSGGYDKPIIGKAKREEAKKKAEAEEPRKNEVSADHPQRIVVSQSGDMAYEYGSGEMSFDEQKTGKHVSFQLGYLRVWKSVDGQCKVAATMVKPVESTIKSN
jgi:ketosteroid isomerase-like protein